LCHVAILTPYLGQLLVIRQELRKYQVKAQVNELDARDIEKEIDEDDVDLEEEKTLASMASVRTATIDNFQGEEADIIIICLVRSNSNRDIGFVGNLQRTNVLLSRARRGMYVLGNKNVLLGARAQSSRELWKKVIGIFEASRGLLPFFPAKCERHDWVHTIKTVQDFELNCKDGGCNLPCGANLSCGHPCPLSCHPDEERHKIEPCVTEVTDECAYGHPVRHVCGKSVNCKRKVSYKCFHGHALTGMCYQGRDKSCALCRKMLDIEQKGQAALEAELAKQQAIQAEIVQVQADAQEAQRLNDAKKATELQKKELELAKKFAASQSRNKASGASASSVPPPPSASSKPVSSKRAKRKAKPKPSRLEEQVEPSAAAVSSGEASLGDVVYPALVSMNDTSQVEASAAVADAEDLPTQIAQHHSMQNEDAVDEMNKAFEVYAEDPGKALDFVDEMLDEDAEVAIWKLLKQVIESIEFGPEEEDDDPIDSSSNLCQPLLAMRRALTCSAGGFSFQASSNATSALAWFDQYGDIHWPSLWRQQLTELTAIKPKAHSSSTVNQDDVFRADWRANESDLKPEAISRMLELVALDSIKQTMIDLHHRVELARVRGEASPIPNANVVFQGNPGTGKTTVARYWGQLLRELDIVPEAAEFVEVTGSGLGFQGIRGLTGILETAKENGGAVIFIDEAYQLVSDREGKKVSLNTHVVTSSMQNVLVGCRCLTSCSHTANPSTLSTASLSGS
jgi:hypothetical protein